MAGRQIIFRTLLVLITGLFLFSCEKPTQIYPQFRVLKVGDDLSWADRNYPDSDWDESGTTTETGIFWVRFDITFDKRIDQISNKGIQMISTGSYEAFWDGYLIGSNGKVSDNKSNEKAGTFISNQLIPDTLCSYGNHTLALRVSNVHNNVSFSSWNSFYIEEYKQSAITNLKTTLFMGVLAGAYLIASIYYLLLFMNQQKAYDKLIFSVLCFLFLSLILIEFMKFYYDYPYYYQIYRLLAIGVLNLTIAVTIPWFLLVHFEVPKKRYLLFSYIAFLVFCCLYWG